MQANEIRIGNWIYYNGKLSKIDLTDFRDILEDEYEINYYKPIPLTEEILLRCGEEYVKVKHLHQLQNLYFALTGKELTYTV